ncbi:phosphoenolpyruvate carboxylase [Sansalvadorimonas sp. 2012CJ34-2]|uniref:Phosphoenolpyruvate carboxylase n=1 Tax=Parendozoicomonas callyspongiae TaxID=2942213 RepID=A0ABT0PHT8_9GAMM|nr:phosphoenolpyruvate carboxylase [Sansalvadorimonas sp. 2012CJ34-2]MCL6270942.1 phosphoenolpyruvate carboxylase [Sansalvadorimonas sp. 2012CJ34-2]
MTDEHAALRHDIHLMGELLGQAMQDHLGAPFLEKIERIRQLSKSARNGNTNDHKELLALLHGLSDHELLPVTRAFTQFLNLANIAEQYHTVSRHSEQEGHFTDSVDELFRRLVDQGFDANELHRQVANLDIELVLTAHPTEVTRRTVIQKFNGITRCLTKLDHTDLMPREREDIIDRMHQLISQIWHTKEIRDHRPTPEDEARWGFATVEHSLWEALPQFLRQLDRHLVQHTGSGLPVSVMPVRFSSWMGGDRDGNPNVTAKVTERVLMTARWMAADLFLRELKSLVGELSMPECSEELLHLAGGNDKEPYRVVLKELRKKLNKTRKWCDAQLAGKPSNENSILHRDEELINPLQICYDSLCANGMSLIANGRLRDLLWRARCFGLGLVRMDIRQEADRHTEVLSELTCYLGLPDYGKVSEEERQEFLLNELANLRPLIPSCWKPSANVQEVLDTCRVIAAQKPERLGPYIISMASTPSDVLAVILILRECGCPFDMPIAPLFETLSDLDIARSSIEKLLSVPWYRDYAAGKQMVMVGYSDSAKDAGQMAAAWAQYRAMEGLTELCREKGVSLTLFHGRGGTVGRGGGPAHQAILSQPPGSVNGHLRVTEQGEMIRFKYGFPQIAAESLSLYASATLEATLLPPPQPEPEWREMMDVLAQDSLKVYRGMVREEPEFVPYFRAATPEQELGLLPLGSRPTKRRPDGGVESLRAIPWIFAWSQNRLMLPAWLGSGAALKRVVERGKEHQLQEMLAYWPFFRARLELLEMVYLKTDHGISSYYDQRLVPQEYRHLGDRLRQLLKEAMEVTLKLKGGTLLKGQPWVRQAIALRNPYSDPLHFLQAELLYRSRKVPESVCEDLARAMMVTITGIAAGMRNTG